MAKPTSICGALFAPADPAFHSGLQFFGLADFVEAAVFSGNTGPARGVIEEMERVSAPTLVPWVETMLHYGKALLAAPEDARTILPARPGTDREEVAIFARTPAPGVWRVAARQRRSANAKGTVAGGP